MLEQRVVCDAAESDENGPKGVAIDDTFHPVSDNPAAQKLYCLSIPYILGQHPFIQGITSSHDMGNIVGAALAKPIAADAAASSNSDRKPND